MNKDTVNGAIDQAVGSAKSHIGHLTGNTGAEVKGAIQQIKGHVETAIGSAKDAFADAQREANEESKREAALADSRKAL